MKAFFLSLAHRWEYCISSSKLLKAEVRLVATATLQDALC